jgi:hypothetical protein
MTSPAAVEVMTMSYLAHHGEEILERHRGARQIAGEGLGPPRRSIGDEHGERPVILKVPGRELSHLPRPHEKDGASIEPVEYLPRELDGGEGHGDGMPPHLGVRAHALGHREGLAHQRVEDGAHGAAGLRGGQRRP